MANRNRTEMSASIFLQLIERARSLDQDFPVDSHRRWIKRLSVEDADLMAKAEVEPLKLSLRNSAAIIKHDGRHYFGASGFDEPDELPDGMEKTPTTPGLFGVFVTELGLRSNGTPAEIRDAIEGFSDNVTDYEGHDLDDIKILFPNVNFYRLDTSYIYAQEIRRTLGSYISRGYSGGPLDIDTETQNCFCSFFEEGPDHIPYELPLRGLLSFSWAGLYLELYRCIEQLYAVPKIVKLTNEWASPQTIYDISKLLENVLSWRPKDDESLEGLFRELGKDFCEDFRRAFKLSQLNDSPQLEPWSGAAKRVYSLRNACVHFRPATQLGEINDNEWNDIARLMLDAVKRLYEQFGDRFHGVETAPA